MYIESVKMSTNLLTIVGTYARLRELLTNPGTYVQPNWVKMDITGIMWDAQLHVYIFVDKLTVITR